MSSVFVVRAISGSAILLHFLDVGNRGRGMPAVGYVLEPRPTKVEDEDDYDSLPRPY